MSRRQSTWRLLRHEPASGAWNIAVDEAILEYVDEQSSTATLRLYAWDPACLSLGYAQPVLDVDRQALSSYGWELVRRPTGGRAILHTDELTYSVIGTALQSPLAGSVLESYRNLAQALLLALQLLGTHPQSSADLRASRANGAQGPVCFEVPSHYEITVQGKKLIGSAQRRTKNRVLQHGSLPLFGDLTRITQVLRFPDAAARESAASRLLEHAATLEQVSAAPITWEQAAGAFPQAFEQALGIHLEPGELTEDEISLARVLVREKYAHPAWTDRV